MRRMLPSSCLMASVSARANIVQMGRLCRKHHSVTARVALQHCTQQALCASMVTADTLTSAQLSCPLPQAIF